MPRTTVFFLGEALPPSAELDPSASSFMTKQSVTNEPGDADTAPADGKAVSASPPPSWLNHDWFWGLALVCAVILTYLPVWRAGFIWDDDINITANPCIVGPLGLKQIWTTSSADICPLTLTTIWLEHALGGLVPLP
jgi:hypothetical protein